MAATAVHLLSDSATLKSWLQIGAYLGSSALLVVVWARWRRGHPDPLVLWGVLSFGLFAAANVLGAVVPMATGRTMQVPSVVDGMFLLAYLLFAWFFVRLGRRSTPSDGRDWLDPLIVVLGVTPLFWLLLIDPVLVGSAITLETATFLAYPALVFVLMTMMVRAAFVAFRLSVPHLLLAGWICLELVADVGLLQAGASGTYEPGQWYQALWLLSATCVGALALHPHAGRMFDSRGNRSVSGPSRLLLLGACLAVPVVTLSYATIAERGARSVLVAAGVALVLVVLTCVRLAKLMIDNAEQRRAQTVLQQLTTDLSFQSLHDALTGLGNRALFAERLEHALATRPTGVDRAAAILLLDLDDFKVVNDTFGHDAGDQVLTEVALRLEGVSRQAESVHRLGGDEFAFVLADARIDDVLRLADRVCVVLGVPYELGPRTLRPLASIGIAIALAGQDRTKLLAEADLAMQAAKAHGAGRPTVFDADLHEAALSRHQLERDLRSAVDSGQLRLLYQPLVDLVSNEMVGVEALLRWDHPTRGLVSPVEFIPLAEVNGAILDIGDWVLREACRQALAWDSDRPEGPLRMSVNVSPRQLADEEFVTRARAIIATTGIDPSRVTMEVTESAFGSNAETMIRRLHELKSLGVTLAIDDFGTGYSSLSQLRRLPVDIIKIDKSFVDGIVREQPEWELTAAIIRLAAGLGKRTLAEGIETGGQLAHLRSLNVELGQGYLFARPLPAPAISGLLHAVPGRAFLFD